MAAKINSKNTELKFKPENFKASIRYSGYFLYYKNRCIIEKFIDLVGKDLDIKQAWQRYWIGQVDTIIDSVLVGESEDVAISNIIKKMEHIDSLSGKQIWIQRMARNLFVGDVIKPFDKCPEFTISAIVKFGDTIRISYNDSDYYKETVNQFYINLDKQVSCLVTIPSKKVANINEPF
jgi:hypothetical protein